MASIVLTDAQILSALADEWKKNVGSMPAYWSSIVRLGHSRAVNLIVSKLVRRGYSYSQIASSDQVGDYELALSLYECIKRGVVVEGNNDVNFKVFDLREELKDVVLTQGGAFVPPAGPVGLPNVGTISAPDDIFMYPPQDGTPPFPPGKFAEDDGNGINW